MTFNPSDYELGEDVTDRFERSKTSPGMVVSFRLGKDEAKELLGEAERTEHTVSQVARLALRHYLQSPQCRIEGTSVATVRSSASPHILSSSIEPVTRGPVIATVLVGLAG